MYSIRKLLALSALIPVLTLTSVSCGTETELCDAPEHPHRVDLAVQFDWEEGMNKPDTMFVLANRVINSWKCGFALSTETGDGKYFFNAPWEDARPDSFMTRVLKGHYRLAAFNIDTTEAVYENLQEFIADSTNKLGNMKDVNLVYKSYNKNDSRLEKPMGNWFDYNPYTDYIQPEMPAIVYSLVEAFDVDGVQTAPCVFIPKPITQNIAIEFKVTKRGLHVLSIDSVFAEMSGIPHKINLATGDLDITKTYKMMFRLKMFDTEGNPLEDGVENYDIDTLVCRASIDVTGLVHSNEADMVTGPGIMCINVYTHAILPANHPDNLSGADIKRKKRIPGVINLCETIKDADLIERLPDKKTARRKRTHGELIIENILLIDSEQVIKYPTGSELDLWMPVEDDIIMDI